LPSELYERHDPTITDFVFVAKYAEILQEEENERIANLVKAMKI